MKALFLSLLFCVLTIVGIESAIAKTVALGGYSNIQSSMKGDPHQSGYSVTLFRRDSGQLFGEFTYAPGTTEGFGGRLYDVENSRSQLSFKAKVSAGYTSTGGSDRTIFEFSGKLERGAISGTLKIWDGYRLDKPIRVESIRLLRSPRIDLSPDDYEEYLKYSPGPSW